MLICWVGLIFVALALPGALRRSGRIANSKVIRNDVETNPAETEDNRPYWQKDPSATALARDRLEVLEIWAKNNEDPMNAPAPIAPTKPHIYFGDESGKDIVD